MYRKATLIVFFCLAGFHLHSKTLNTTSASTNNLLADVTNSATVGAPAATSTPTPSATPTSTPTPTPLSCNDICNPNANLCPGDSPWCINYKDDNLPYVCGRTQNIEGNSRCDLQAVNSPQPQPTTTATPTPTPTPVPATTPTPTPTLLPKLTIYGYGPANSKAYLNGIGVSSETNTSTQGYFQFNDIYSSATSSQYLYPELCIFASDHTHRVTQPACIPPLPLEASSQNIGPILLSPTLSLESSKVNIGQQTLASGITTPNTSVRIFAASINKSNKPTLSLVHTAHAYSLPQYEIQSDTSGYFEFNLPNQNPTEWKIFATSQILGANSPKSNTLTFSIISGLSIFTKLLQFILTGLSGNILHLIITIEVIILLIILAVLLRMKLSK